jgi:hypothetical protein
MSLSKILAVASIVVVLASSAAVAAGQKTRLSGDDLKKMYSNDLTIAGYNLPTDVTWMITHSADGTRTSDWRSPTNSGTGAGTADVEGDRLCTTWGSSRTCYDVYKVGDNKFQAYVGDTLFTVYYVIKPVD